MADTLRPRLDRLQELSKKLNAATDDAGRIVQGVEAYLNDVLHLGLRASVEIKSESNDDGYESSTELVYGRYGQKCRIHIAQLDIHQGMPVNVEETLWANCPRDLKLAAYNSLPALLDALIKNVEATLEDVEVNTGTIETLLPVTGSKTKKEAKS